MNVMVGPGEHVIATWPGYQSLYEVARATGAEMSLHGLHESDGWAIDIDRLRSELRPTTRLIVINTPHNPTGMMVDRTTYDGLLEICEDNGIRLFMDEVYRGLEFDETDRLVAGADALPMGISLGVMSKAYALAGLRIGWIATHDHDLLARLAAFKDYTTICSSAPSEILAIIALRARDQVLERSRGIIAANLELVDGFFEDYLDRFTWIRPSGGFDRVPAADRPGRRDRRLGGRPGQGRGRAAAAGVRVRLFGQPLPARVRPGRPARGARAAGGVRGADPALTVPAAWVDVSRPCADPSRRRPRAPRTRAPARIPCSRSARCR